MVSMIVLLVVLAAMLMVVLAMMLVLMFGDGGVGKVFQFRVDGSIGGDFGGSVGDAIIL